MESERSRDEKGDLPGYTLLRLQGRKEGSLKKRLGFKVAWQERKEVERQK